MNAGNNFGKEKYSRAFSAVHYGAGILKGIEEKPVELDRKTIKTLKMYRAHHPRKDNENQ